MLYNGSRVKKVACLYARIFRRKIKACKHTTPFGYAKSSNFFYTLLANRCIFLSDLVFLSIFFWFSSAAFLLAFFLSNKTLKAKSHIFLCYDSDIFFRHSSAVMLSDTAQPNSSVTEFRRKAQPCSSAIMLSDKGFCQH